MVKWQHGSHQPNLDYFCFLQLFGLVFVAVQSPGFDLNITHSQTCTHTPQAREHGHADTWPLPHGQMELRR